MKSWKLYTEKHNIVLNYCFRIFIRLIFFVCLFVRLFNWKVINKKTMYSDVKAAGLVQIHIRTILKSFVKYICLGIAFFTPEFQICFQWLVMFKNNRTILYDDLLLLSSLFHFFYFIFSAPFSFSLCFPIFPSLFFLWFSQAFIKHNRNAFVHTYINTTYNMYILKTYIFA